MAGGTIVDGLTLGIIAAALGGTTASINQSDLRRLTQLVGPIVPFVLVPAVCMLLQVLPIPGHWLAHSIWSSAAAALGGSFSGLVSIDVGATLLCLARYSQAVGIAVVATAVALDRQRAEAVLVSLTAAAALIGAALMFYDLGYLRIADFNRPASRAEALNVAILGLILAGATAIRLYERYRSRRPPNRIAEAFLAATSGLGLVIGLFVIFSNPTPILIFAGVIGLGTLSAMMVIRQLALGLWGQAGIAAIVVVAAVGFIAGNSPPRETNATLAFANRSEASIAAAERMLSDATWTGSGAGTFEALFPIYRAVGDPSSGVVNAPTAAASIAIELGSPMLWALTIAALVGGLLLFHRALLRGRDYVYPGAGAACLFALVILSFGNPGMFGRAITILVAATCGVALAQSRSWST